MDEFDSIPVGPYIEPPAKIFAERRVPTGPKDEEWEAQLQYIIGLDRARKDIVKQLMAIPEDQPEPPELLALYDELLYQWAYLREGLTEGTDE